ncbi:MAG: hypothetical protein KatS3mg027_0501 [Bacteroidia bacterium]|nr:MAG: hypothetical protein KatS3mg027_0501 [Bacteroidia bacterium]
MNSIKDTIRKFFFECNIPATVNLRNDILLKKILKQILSENDNTIDVGCHKGEIMEVILRYAPKGQHYAVEPIPCFYESLKRKFTNVKVFPYAVSDEDGTTEFYWIKDNPAYSGLSKRKFSEENADISPLVVDVKRLDEIIPENVPIKFIKIDVEGAELKVLKGAEKIINHYHPYVAFEFGLGGSDYYNTTASDMFHFFESKNYQLYDFESFLKKQASYTLNEFERTFKENIVYNFIAVHRL